MEGSLTREPLSETAETLGLLSHYGVDVRAWSLIRTNATVGFHAALAIRRMVSGHEDLPITWESVVTVAKKLRPSKPLLTWDPREAQHLIQTLGLYTEVFNAASFPSELHKFHDFDKPQGVQVSIAGREYMVVGVDPVGWNNYPKTGGPQSITEVVVTRLPLMVRTRIKYGLMHLPGGKD